MSASLLDILTDIHQERGTLTAALLVEESRPPEHPLHSRIGHDRPAEEMKYEAMLARAGQLLRVVKLPDDPSRPHDLRAFVAIRGAGSRAAEYVPTEKAMGDEVSGRILLASMEREWKSFKRRWEHMSEFASLILSDIHEGSVA